MSTDDEVRIAEKLALITERAAVADEVALIEDRDLPAPRPTDRRSARSGAILAAAMLGVGEVIEPQKTEVAIEQLADGGDDDTLITKLDFGGLPPLN